MTDMLSQDKNIIDLIYIIRGQQVMLDRDLAELYGYELKRLSEQVKNNIRRFPGNFRFQLTKEEFLENLKSKNSTSSEHGGKRKLPFVFTKQGLYMLATVLRGKLAETRSILIMRTFKKMRHYIVENQTLLNNTDVLKLSNTVYQNEKEIHSIKNTMATKSDIEKIMDNFIDETNIKEITILNGQKFEAIEAYTKIYKESHKSIYIIDDYININTLPPLKYKKENVDVILFSDNKGTSDHKLRQHEIDMFNTEYPNLTLKRNRIAHDRYIIIDHKTDNEKIYHCGASSKDAGKKICGMNELSDYEVLHGIVDNLLGI